MAFGKFVVILVISCRLAYGTIPLSSISGVKKDLVGNVINLVGSSHQASTSISGIKTDALGNVLNLASSVLHTDNSGIKQGVVEDILNIAESTLHKDISVVEKDAIKDVLNIAGSTLHEDISVIEKDAVEDVLNTAKDITEVTTHLSMDLCSSTNCTGNTTCVHGICIPSTIGVVDLCKVVTCPKNYSCANGICVPTCESVKCPTGQRCVLQDIICLHPPCNPIPICKSDSIIVDPCESIKCPKSSTCTNGTCVFFSCGNVEKINFGAGYKPHSLWSVP